MKGVFYLFTVLVLTVSCSAEPSESIEDQIYAEVKSEFKKNGIDLESYLDDVEDQMIAEGLLIGKGGLAKVKYYEIIAESGEIPSLKDRSMLELLFETDLTSQIIVECDQIVRERDSVAYDESEYFKRGRRIKTKAYADGIGIISFVNALLLEVDAEDFDKPYYRMYMLISSIMSMDKDTAYIRETPELEKDPTSEIDPKTIIDIRTNKLSQVSVNKKVVTIEEFESYFSSVYDSIGSDAVIYLRVHPSTIYDTYVNIQSGIEAYAYYTRNAEAERSFHMRYEELNDLQKQQVDEAHPMRIVESKYE